MFDKINNESKKQKANRSIQIPNKDKKLSFLDLSELENVEDYIYQIISLDETKINYYQFKVTLLESSDTNLRIV